MSAPTMLQQPVFHRYPYQTPTSQQSQTQINQPNKHSNVNYNVNINTRKFLLTINIAGFFTNEHFLFNKFGIIGNQQEITVPQWKRSSLTFIAAGSAGAAGAWITMPLDTVCVLHNYNIVYNFVLSFLFVLVLVLVLVLYVM